MNFKVVFDNDADILREDGSLSLGYFEVLTKDLKISFFSERSCMIFLTLTTLIDFFDKNKKSFEWVGEDNGKVFSITKKEPFLEIKDKKTVILLNRKDFEDAARAAAIRLLSDAQNVNASINSESAFISLQMTV